MDPANGRAERAASRRRRGRLARRGAAVRDGVRLAGDLAAPVVFVYVRRGPSATLGEPYYQRRLDAEMRIGDGAIAAGIAAARRAGVRASGEQLHGTTARRLEEFARLRDARLIVVGARRRWLGRSVSRAVIRRADRPVVVARRTSPARADSRPAGVTSAVPGPTWVPNGGRIGPRTHGSRGLAETPLLVSLLAKERSCHTRVFPVPKSRDSGKSDTTGPSLAAGSGPASDVASWTVSSRTARIPPAAPSSPSGPSS